MRKVHQMDQTTAIRLLVRLGVGPGDLQRVQQTPYPQSVAVLEELKVRVKASFKRLAFELHPDRTGGDPTKTEEFKGLVQVASDFEKFTVHARPQQKPEVRMPIQVVFVQYHSPRYPTNPFTRTPDAARPLNTWHFVNMKP